MRNYLDLLEDILGKQDAKEAIVLKLVLDLYLADTVLTYQKVFH